jgi:hypothetical protein
MKLTLPYVLPFILKARAFLYQAHFLNLCTDIRYPRCAHVSSHAVSSAGGARRIDHPGRRRWRSDVNSYPGLDGQTKLGPTYVYEYSTRAAYGSNIPWGQNDPLNATWWHLVTERACPLLLRSSLFLSPFFPSQRCNRTRTSSRCAVSCVSSTLSLTN